MKFILSIKQVNEKSALSVKVFLLVKISSLKGRSAICNF